MKKIMLLANRDFVLYNFRFELIQKLIDDGREVVICLPYGPKVDLMTNAGARFIPLDVDRRGKNPFKDMGTAKELEKIFTDERPDVILLYTTKVCIYGGIVAQKLGIPYIINVSGLGTAVKNPSIIQPVTIGMYKKAVQGAKCVFYQNKQDKMFFHDHQIFPGKEKVIPGSGVNVEKWKYLEYPDEKNGIHFLFAGRIIREKGIELFLHAANEIQKAHKKVFFHVAGPCDGRYSSVLAEYQKKGVIVYHGEVEDIAELLKISHCLIHPSYYPEGISNVCLEAAVSGRAIITTDNPGCSETVNNEISGYVVPKRNIKLLLDAVDKFLSLSADARKQMGINGRNKIICEFDRRMVLDAYDEEIQSILGKDK